MPKKKAENTEETKQIEIEKKLDAETQAVSVENTGTVETGNEIVRPEDFGVVANVEAPEGSLEEEPVIKSGFAKVKLENFTGGTYRDAQFDGEGVCERISRETLESLAQQFPGIKVADFEVIE
jgi:hypothetical protein